MIAAAIRPITTAPASKSRWPNLELGDQRVRVSGLWSTSVYLYRYIDFLLLMKTIRLVGSLQGVGCGHDAAQARWHVQWWYIT